MPNFDLLKQKNKKQKDPLVTILTTLTGPVTALTDRYTEKTV
jgi:hypothetical protein